MRKFFTWWSVPCAIFLLAIGGNPSTVSAQSVPWHIDQGSDGTLYLVTGDTHYVVNPDAISDESLAALIDGGVLGSQLPLQPAPAPVIIVAPAVPLPVLVEPTATLTPVPVTLPTSTPVPAAPIQPAVGTHDNPLPMGAAGQLKDGWRIVVASITSDATSLVLHHNQFNTPPAPGNQFFLARIQATYTGSDSQKLSATLRFRTLGPGAVSYTTFGNSCGSYADELTNNEVFSGGTITGNLCWQIRSSDAGGLEMYDAGVFDSSPTRVYFALR